MARQIIVLDTQPNQGGINQVRAVFWFPISPASAQVPKPSFVSAAAGVTGAGAITPGEQASLESGAVLEEVQTVPYATTTTTAQIKADLIARYGTRASYLAGLQPTRQYFGVYYDGTSWSA